MGKGWLDLLSTCPPRHNFSIDKVNLSHNNLRSTEMTAHIKSYPIVLYIYIALGPLSWKGAWGGGGGVICPISYQELANKGELKIFTLAQLFSERILLCPILICSKCMNYSTIDTFLNNNWKSLIVVNLNRGRKVTACKESGK